MAMTAEQWASDVVLGDGETVHIRPIRPTDADALRAFHLAQPADNNYRRYFSPKPTLSERELEHFTNVDMVDRVGLVVEERGQMIAWASYERWKGRDDADAAFQVDDRHQGRGIATLLLEHLAAIARTNGIKRFTAEVLADNRPMLAVFSRAGWPVQRRFESGVVDLDWPLEDTSEFVDSVERREQRADSRAVARLLMPRTIAVVGASDRAQTVGAVVWQHVSTAATGPTYPVNPAHDTVGGQRSWPTIASIPDDIHLAVVAVPSEELVAVLEDCIDARVRGAVVITSVDAGDEAIGEVMARARRYGVRIIGPGSMGVSSPTPGIGLHAALVPMGIEPGHVAVSMQSGSLGASMLLLVSALGMGLSWYVSLGDKADISGNDLLQFWEDDETTRVIAMYTESFGNPRKFVRIARRVSRRRPIVAVRTGSAAIGPTGSALYYQAGLIEVPTVPALLDTARVLATQPVPHGPNVAMIANSASPAALTAAALEAAGLSCREPAVPLDHRSRAEDYAAALDAAFADPDVHAVLVVHAPPIADLALTPIAELTAAAAGQTKPLVAVLLGAPDGPLEPGSDIPVFTFPEAAAAVLGRMWSYRQWLDGEGAMDAAQVGLIDQPRGATIVSSALARGDDELGVEQTLALFAAYGITMPPTRAVDAADAPRAAASVGYPVAVKAERRHLGRTVAAGVGLDLTDAADVVAAVEAMQQSLGGDADRVVVQAMIPPGLDVRIRATVDERLGAVIAVGLGGRDADLIADEESRLTPLSTTTAARLVAESRAGAAIAKAGLEPDGVEDLLVRIAQLVTDQPEIIEVDINPLIVGTQGVWITDATVRIAPRTVGTTPLRRLE